MLDKEQDAPFIPVARGQEFAVDIWTPSSRVWVSPVQESDGIRPEETGMIMQ